MGDDDAEEEDDDDDDDEDDDEDDGGVGAPIFFIGGHGPHTCACEVAVCVHMLQEPLIVL